jgi:CrcB protein
MVINVVGSLMLGALMGLATRQSMAEPLRVAMSVGLLGGFTTFSAFSWDCWLCFSRGEWGRGIALLIGTPLLGVLGAAAAHRWILAH